MSIERCASCQRALVIIEMAIDGRTHLMASCSHCNTRRWRRDDATIDLGGVLEVLTETSGRGRGSSRT
jgi:hypothetical protein